MRSAAVGDAAIAHARIGYLRRQYGYALALAIGSTLGTMHGSGILPDACAVAVMALGGLFVGMLASALTEALEVIPSLFDRLSVTADMRFAAAAMAVGKTAGAILAGLMGA